MVIISQGSSPCASVPPTVHAETVFLLLFFCKEVNFSSLLLNWGYRISRVPNLFQCYSSKSLYCTIPRSCLLWGIQNSRLSFHKDWKCLSTGFNTYLQPCFPDSSLLCSWDFSYFPVNSVHLKRCSLNSVSELGSRSFIKYLAYHRTLCLSLMLSHLRYRASIS